MRVSTTSSVFNQHPSAADWIAPRLPGEWGHVTGVVPAGFPAYAQILHPVDDGVTWAHVADEIGTVVHPLVQWLSLLRRRPSATDWTWRGTGPGPAPAPTPKKATSTQPYSSRSSPSTPHSN